MSEEKKDQEQAPPQWKHDQELSFAPAKEVLLKAKEGIEAMLAAKKRELAQMVGARDSLKK